MAWWKFGAKKADFGPPKQAALNPNLRARRSAGFTSSDVNRVLMGWETTSNSIDYYLQTELQELRARSRKMVRANPYGKRFIAMIKSNVVGPTGVAMQAQSTIFRTGSGLVLDAAANDAIEAEFKRWGRAANCDYCGKSNWLDLQNLAISCAGQDGEFVFRKYYEGPYGFQLRCIDPELLDVKKNVKETRGGGEIRLGVEYDRSGRVIYYWFREKSSSMYDSGQSFRVPAKQIIHGFINEWPDQSRGAPWMHAALERTKHLEKYDESAIVKARSTASTMAVLRSPNGEDPYEGDTEFGDGVTLDEYEPGTIKDIGDREIVNLDSDYPHEMYASFVKAQLQGIASGLGISYHSLSNDLAGVNYSSIRAGVLEDREVFKGLQGWFIRSFIEPVYEEWLEHAYARDIIKIGSRPLRRPLEEYKSVHFQGRRWAWVDPQKDGAANQLAVDYNLKSRSQIMRDSGDDPETTWREIQRENEQMKSFGIVPQQLNNAALAAEEALDDQAD